MGHKRVLFRRLVGYAQNHYQNNGESLFKDNDCLFICLLHTSLSPMDNISESMSFAMFLFLIVDQLPMLLTFQSSLSIGDQTHLLFVRR